MTKRLLFFSFVYFYFWSPRGQGVCRRLHDASSAHQSHTRKKRCTFLGVYSANASLVLATRANRLKRISARVDSTMIFNQYFVILAYDSSFLPRAEMWLAEDDDGDLSDHREPLVNVPPSAPKQNELIIFFSQILLSCALDGSGAAESREPRVRRRLRGSSTRCRRSRT